MIDEYPKTKTDRTATAEVQQPFIEEAIGRVKPADEALAPIDLANVRNNMLEFGIVARGAFA